jgi:hypothetical protein
MNDSNSTNKNIQISNLPLHTQALAVEELCCKYGRVLDTVPRGGRSFIVAFDSHADAEFALYRLNGMNRCLEYLRNDSFL